MPKVMYQEQPEEQPLQEEQPRQIRMLVCRRCKHEWIPRENRTPRKCPNTGCQVFLKKNPPKITIFEEKKEDS